VMFLLTVAAGLGLALRADSVGDGEPERVGAPGEGADDPCVLPAEQPDTIAAAKVARARRLIEVATDMTSVSYGIRSGWDSGQSHPDGFSSTEEPLKRRQTEVPCLPSKAVPECGRRD
jgi:hypothetical protein